MEHPEIAPQGKAERGPVSQQAVAVESGGCALVTTAEEFADACRRYWPGAAVSSIRGNIDMAFETKPSRAHCSRTIAKRKSGTRTTMARLPCQTGPSISSTHGSRPPRAARPSGRVTQACGRRAPVVSGRPVRAGVALMSGARLETKQTPARRRLAGVAPFAGGHDTCPRGLVLD